MRRLKIIILNAVLVLCMIQLSFGQDAVPPRPSPLAIVSARYKDHYIKVTYSQPHKKGREVFGKLVPFGKIWRTGANEATEITTARNIMINGFLLKAGTYSLFTIPEENSWTIIINSELGLWGSYNYNSALDVTRFNVPVQKIDGDLMYEAFTIHLDQQNEKTTFQFFWDKTKITVPIQLIN